MRILPHVGVGVKVDSMESDRCRWFPYVVWQAPSNALLCAAIPDRCPRFGGDGAVWLWGKEDRAPALTDRGLCMLASPSGRSSNRGSHWNCCGMPPSRHWVARVELGRRLEEGAIAGTHHSWPNREATDPEYGAVYRGDEGRCGVCTCLQPLLPEDFLDDVGRQIRTTQNPCSSRALDLSLNTCDTLVTAEDRLAP